MIGECGASETIHAWALSGAASRFSTMPSMHVSHRFSSQSGHLQAVHPLSTIHSVAELVLLIVSSIVLDYLLELASF